MPDAQPRPTADAQPHPAPDGQHPPDPMAGRIVRHRDLPGRGIPLMFIDSILPGHQRLNYAIIGDTASENPDFRPLISAPHKFQIGMVKAPPGNGPAYHTHDYVESFLVLKGRWRFYWGSDPDPERSEGETVLDEWDYISLPPGLYRGFHNASDADGWVFAVLEPHEVFAGKDPYWSPAVERAAADYGFRADERGRMIKPPNYEELRDELAARLEGRR